ncbi:MAG: bifunctional DNA-binding transcriptional regulator/O6-methylguanine-DNA methyltransferase Ada [Planctomycetes bacterium]|nr:bifunctional DNA-binding transcriptional regulator/O6-methylguanine-DNA methyltransferase Ada [Planctomycetota bacterium]
MPISRLSTHRAAQTRAAAATLSDPRWAAVVARDRGQDGCFVYAVRTTGVYCRPSCPSRQPRPENVSFHATPALAESAGFRACRRCRPAQAAPAHAHAATVTRICRLIATSDPVPSLNALAAAAGLSPHHFHRVFKAITGVTPKGYAQAQRAGRVRAELATPRSVTSALYAAGWQSSGRFYAASTALLGMTPTALRRGGAGATIRFAVGSCSLGAVLVAASAVGVCAILLGDDAATLVRDVQERFPRAELCGDDPDFACLVARVVGFIDVPGRDPGLPLDIRGTAFQQRVWQALREIPAGRTASYAEIARRIGEPKSVRAVAQACGANRIAVAIPCHRVLRNDGALSGYRWGVERKRALLQGEANA